MRLRQALVNRQANQSIIRPMASELHQLQTYLDKRFDGIDKRFEAIDQRFAGIDSQFAAAAAQFTAVDRKLDGVEAGFQQQFSDLQSSVDAYMKQVETFYQETLALRTCRSAGVPATGVRVRRRAEARLLNNVVVAARRSAREVFR
jgi:hypothetical protein